MRKLNLSTALTVAGDATTGNISWVGLTNPTVTEVTDNPDVTVNADGSFTLGAGLESGSESVTVHVEDAGGYWIEGPVVVTGDGTGVEYMQLGMNLGTPNAYSGLYPFANMMWSANVWERFSASGTFQQYQGTVTSDDPATIYRAYLTNNGYKWPGGTFRVLNPDGCEIGFGPHGAPEGYHAWTTSTDFTVNMNPSGGNGASVFVRGSLTNINGPLQIIRNDHYLQFILGNIWANEFISFHTALNCNPYRFMDWNTASNNAETEWSHRTQPDAISIRNGCALGQPVVPWEAIIDLCNRMNVDAWACVPVRASQDYIDNLAALFGTDLDASLSVYPERGNETWNGGAAWFDGQQWTNYINSPWLIATANLGANTFTYAGHGMSTGATVRCFDTAENRIASLNQQYPFTGSDFSICSANVSYVEAVDANTFKLYKEVGRTTLITVAAKQVNLMFTKAPVSAATNVGQQHIQLWDAFEAELGIGRVKHLIPTQSGSTGVTTNRFSNTAAAARADYVSPAPYYNGNYFAAQVTTASGQFAPDVWVATDGTPVCYRVYASGATPTVAEILAGTGALAGAAGTANDGAVWNRAAAGLAAVTGFTNGVSYEHFFVFNNVYKLHATIAATASATVTGIFDSYANQARRMLTNAFYTAPTEGGYDHITASGGKAVICYENGPDFNAPKPAAAGGVDVDAWRVALQASPEYGAANIQAQYIRAAQNIDMMCFFADAGIGSFSLAPSYADTTEDRYTLFTALGGRVQKRTRVSVDDIAATDIPNEPKYPYDVCTFADPALTYTILGGNNDERFDISGGKLRIINANGVDWGTIMPQDVSIMADDGYTIDIFRVEFIIGSVVISDADTIAYLARFSTPPSLGFQGLLQTAIVASKAAGLWDTKWDVFNLHPAGTKADAYLNAFDPAYNLIEAGTMDHDPGLGSAGDGSTGYLRTGFVPSTAPSPKFTQNSATLLVWILDESDDPNGYVVGQTASATAQFNPRSSSGPNFRGQLNGAFGLFTVAPSSIGMMTLSRTASNLTTASRNKTTLSTSNTGSTGVPTTEMIFGRSNTAYSTHRMAITAIGGALTTGQRDTFYDIWQAFLAGIGTI